MDLDLKGRVALVTGAAAGIGEAIARALAGEACSVWLLDRDRGGAENVAGALTSTGHRATALVVDVANHDAVSAVFAEIVQRTGRLDILVNAAGLLSTGLVADLPPSEWDRVSRVNVSGIINCVKAALPSMAAQRRGRIINIASISAMRGGGSIGNTIYGATKASVVALTKGLARELGPQGITVNAVAPAIADTAMTHAALTAEARQRILLRIPLGRLAAPSDIADMVAFLASDRAAFITGTTIPVDGGILTT
ncbi:MAG TPA: SDR family NAD(P)-dependent oxidoreductase [Bradyrhizobium sp.]|jgi:NAD(P)-dependent dehydrogenase (short-subunit alcohol dehydrogenase family)|nr:SDR family NAD(P)-dependent oxidoreductase [Bradyrhizobium sp.]